ncbi:DUF4190 domain-containing protein [Phycisphaeraceae bacterium D3-23]
MPNTPQHIADTSYACDRCGYDLSGSAVGGVCPECGHPVRDSLRVSAAQSPGGTSSSAMVSMVLGIIAITACGLVGPVAIVMSYRAKEDIREGKASPSTLGMAKAGLILGWISSILTVAGILLYAAILAVTI